MVHPGAAQADCTVWFGLGDDAPDGLRWEGLLALRLNEDRVRLCAVPFWLYGPSLGDEIAVMASAENALVATEILRQGGRRTFRVVLPPEAAWSELIADLERLDCWFDVRTPRYVAIAVADSDAQTLEGELSARETRGELQYEAGDARR